MLILYKSLVIIFILLMMKYRKLPLQFYVSKENKYFNKLLKISKNRLIESVDIFSSCIKNNTIMKCMKKNNEIYKFKKITYTNHIMNFKNGLNIYKILITPKIIIQSRNIVIIPVAPSELIARIAVRSTWYSIKKTEKGKELSYLFYIGKPEMLNNSYPIFLLYEEAKNYNDILLIDVENSYIRITLLILMCYKFVLENFPNCKYVIRVNSDMIFYPQKLDKMIFKEKYVIGYKNKAMGIEYLSGAFYVVSIVYVDFILKKSKKVIPMSFYDDIYFGQINKMAKFINIAYINKYNYYLPVTENNQNMLYDKNSSIIGAHSVNSNAILFFWKLRGYKLSIL